MMRRRIVFHDPRISSRTGGGESLTLRKIAVLDPARFQVNIVTRKTISSPLLGGFLRDHPEIEVIEIEAAREGCDERVRHFLEENNGLHLWGKDWLVDDGIRFNAVAVALYRRSDWDLASVSVLTDLFGLDLQQRSVLHIYGCPPPDMARAEGPLLSRVHAVSAVSRFVRDEFCSAMTGWIEPRSVEILAPGLPPEFLSRRPEVRQRDVDFVYAGRLVQRKGVDLILHALHQIRLEHTLIPKVVIAGDGEMKDELVGLSKALAVADQVHFAGSLSQDQLIALLDRARWFLYPVRKPEAFGLAPIEAMARGVPAIVGELGGMIDYMEANRNGFVIPHCSSDLLAATMSQACREPILRDTFAVRCVETARQFSWKTFAKDVNAFFDRACSSVC